MNFSFSRFGYLLKLQLAVNRKLYFLGIASIAGILLGFMFFLSYVSEFGYDAQEFVFATGLILSSAIFSSTIFRQFTKTDDRIMAMMLPASAGERLAVALLLTIVVYPLVFVLICIPCTLLMNYINLHWNRYESGFYLPVNVTALYAFLLNICIQSFMLLGAIWFRRHVFVKSMIAVCLLVFAVVLVNNGSARTMINKSGTMEFYQQDTLYNFDSAVPYYSINLQAHTKVAEGMYNIGHYYHVALRPAVQIPFLLVPALILVLLWCVTWMKIREQQL